MKAREAQEKKDSKRKSAGKTGASEATNTEDLSSKLNYEDQRKTYGYLWRLAMLPDDAYYKLIKMLINQMAW